MRIIAVKYKEMYSLNIHNGIVFLTTLRIEYSQENGTLSNNFTIFNSFNIIASF